MVSVVPVVGVRASEAHRGQSQLKLELRRMQTRDRWAGQWVGLWLALVEMLLAVVVVVAAESAGMQTPARARLSNLTAHQDPG